MLRSMLGIGLATVLLSGQAALGQVMTPPGSGTPYAPGYPPEYGYAPFAMPMGPGAPYGYPGAMPPGMMMPVQFRGAPGPVTDSAIATTLPDRLPDSLPPSPNATLVSQPKDVPTHPPAAEPYSVYQGVAVPAAAPACEPIAVYEGRQYFSATKYDNTCFWVRASYLYMRIKPDSTPPLVTTGDAANPTAGTLGNADTVTLVGGDIGPRDFSGFSASAGVWLDPERLSALEVNGFLLGRHSSQYVRESNGAGLPPLSIPILTPAESIAIITAPGVASGGVTVRDTFDMHGIEANLTQNFIRYAGFGVDGLFGFRYLYMNDNLTINQNLTSLGGLTLLGNPVTSLQISDSFKVSNAYFGAQAGARASWTFKGFDVIATFNAAMGGTIHQSTVAGTSSAPAQGLATTGGVLAQSTNIGTRTSSDYSMVWEAILTAGYRLTPNVRVYLSYNYLSWSNVERAGNQIDRNVSPQQIPSNPAFNPGFAGASPVYQDRRSDFWAQGINVGIELRY